VGQTAAARRVDWNAAGLSGIFRRLTGGIGRHSNAMIGGVAIQTEIMCLQSISSEVCHACLLVEDNELMAIDSARIVGHFSSMFRRSNLARRRGRPADLAGPQGSPFVQ
jgi:hypothetical protein